jgi:hypothetical protein
MPKNDEKNSPSNARNANSHSQLQDQSDPPQHGGFLRLDLLPEVVQKNMEVSNSRDAGYAMKRAGWEPISAASRGNGGMGG